MEKCFFGIIVLLALVNNLFASDKNAPPEKLSISVTLHADITKVPDSVSLQIRHLPDEFTPDPKTIYIQNSKKSMQWVVEAGKPVSMIVSFIRQDNNYFYWILEPGDNIIVDLKNGKLSFSGKGSEKLNLGNEIYTALENVKKPSNSLDFNTKSLDDFLEYNTYLNEQLYSIEPILNAYKDKVTEYFFNYLKAATIFAIERKRCNKFYTLFLKNNARALSPSLTSIQLSHIYDSVFFTGPAIWMRKQLFYFVGANDCFGFSRTQVLRKLNFPSKFSSKEHLVDLFEEGKKLYNGLARELFLSSTMVNWVIDEVGFTSETEIILDKYYNELKRPAYKAYVKEMERKAGKVYVGKPAPYFNLLDTKGKLYNNITLLGKVTLMKFHASMYNDCTKDSSIVQKIINEFKSDTNFVILNIISHTFPNKFEPENGVYCLTNDSSLLKAYGAYSCPGIQLIGPEGKLIADSTSFINQQELAQLIRTNLTKIWVSNQDGPYILNEDGRRNAYNFTYNKATTKALKTSNFLVHTDEPDTYFEVILKDSIKVEPSNYNKPSKLLAMSDIEGNFDVLRKLLQANKVIDDHFNWIFANGHLVLTGDLVDRGNQVTECLWLIYALEEKAKSAGGYVHLILGNHEIMNLSGDLRYVQKKYKKNAEEIAKDFSKDLYGENSELGKWLRSKNIVEKIGNCLFVHGGISEEINNTSLSVIQLNDIARPYYDKDSAARWSNNSVLSLIYNSDLSPFWYRSYYQVDSIKRGLGRDGIITTFKTSEKMIDAVLRNYQVKKIITGHTIYKGSNGNFGRQIAAHYDNKVINTDTKHADGYSEALLIENNKYYRVDGRGMKSLLFEEHK